MWRAAIQTHILNLSFDAIDTEALMKIVNMIFEMNASHAAGMIVLLWAIVTLDTFGENDEAYELALSHVLTLQCSENDTLQITWLDQMYTYPFADFVYSITILRSIVAYEFESEAKSFIDIMRDNLPMQVQHACDVLQNTLQPFDVLAHVKDLRMFTFNVGGIDLGPFEEFQTEYGFVRNSMQHNFFKTDSEQKVVIVLAQSQEPPQSMVDPSVVVRMFGERMGDEFLLWHVSINKNNSRNMSYGKYWGFYGIRPSMVGTYRVWYDGEKRLTELNAIKHVKGTPNPYVVHCIVKFAGDWCQTFRQHPDMPCSKLFRTNMNQKTHPSTLLIYSALDFVYSIDSYVWLSSKRSFQESYELMVRRMKKGLPVVM